MVLNLYEIHWGVLDCGFYHTVVLSKATTRRRMDPRELGNRCDGHLVFPLKFIAFGLARARRDEKEDIHIIL